MKIAIITSGFLPVVDGVTVSGFERLRWLSRWGHQVRLFCPDYRELEAMYPDWRDYTGEILPGVRVVNLPSTPFLGLDFERNVSRAAHGELTRELQAFGPDVIHVDEPERLAFGFLRVPGVDWARRQGIPCVGFFRTNFLDYADDYLPLPPFAIASVQWVAGKFLRYIYNSYDVTLTTSQVADRNLVQLGVRNLYRPRVELVGIDTEVFNPNRRTAGFFEQQYGLPDLDGKVKLIFLGRLTPDKGWEFALDSFSRVFEEVDRDRVAILVAGDGPLRDTIATRLGQLTPHAHLLGRVPPERVPALLANSDLHVTASEKETRGLTVLEAFAAGIPVLAPRAGGVTENIQDGWNGLFFTPRNTGEFVQKLKLLIEDGERRREMGVNGRRSMERYSWERAVGNLVRVWERQCQGDRGATNFTRKREVKSSYYENSTGV
ncbi:MAG: glycosyltransferase [Limnospira sp.]